MKEETMNMLVWALEHPEYYTLIQLKQAIIAVSVASIIKSILIFIKKGK